MANYTGAKFLSDVAESVEMYRASVHRDLEAMTEASMWERPVPGMASAANLALHLAGNLRHFVGHHLAGSGYVRDRDREFSEERWAGKARVLEMWDEACVETRTALLALGADIVSRPAPVPNHPGGAPVHTYLARLATHLSYHAGQIRMLRRLLVAEP